jgi:hypothetical protein
LKQLAFAGLLLVCAAAGQTDADLDRVRAAEKVYFRDIHEFPMDVSVTTVVTDPKGISKQVAQGWVGFIFRGYNPATETSTFYTESSVFKIKLRGQSMTGHNVVLHSGAVFRSKPAEGDRVEVQKLPDPGNPWLVTSEAKSCPPFDVWPNSLLPKYFCGVNKFWLAPGEGNDLIFQHYRLESKSLPAEVKLPYLGVVQLTAFTADEEFQQARLPGDAKPFLIPLQVVSTFVTNKGHIGITNLYTPRAKK